MNCNCDEDDIFSSCENLCIKCFSKHLEKLESEDAEYVLSLVVDYEFAEGIEAVLRSFVFDFENNDYGAHLSVFEKICLGGNTACVEKFLKYGGMTTETRVLNISIIISKPKISNLIKKWKSENELPEIKCPDDFYIDSV